MSLAQEAVIDGKGGVAMTASLLAGRPSIGLLGGHLRGTRIKRESSSENLANRQSLGSRSFLLFSVSQGPTQGSGAAENHLNPTPATRLNSRNRRNMAGRVGQQQQHHACQKFSQVAPGTPGFPDALDYVKLGKDEPLVKSVLYVDWKPVPTAQPQGRTVLLLHFFCFAAPLLS